MCRVVGYNNGVIHFGHRYPGKTIVSTVRCRRPSATGRGRLKADCGATVREALDFLAASRRGTLRRPELLLRLPGDRLLRADPRVGRRLLHGGGHDRPGRPLRPGAAIGSSRPSRDEPAFIEHVYNLRSRVVVLRLYLLAKPKSGYFVRSETLKNPSADDLLAALRDRERHERRDPPGPCRERKGHGLPVLQGPRRHVRAGPRAPPRRPGPALGPPGGEPGDLVPHARPEPARGLAHGAVLHDRGVRALLADARPAPPAQDPAALHPPRRDAPFALPRRRLRLGRPVHVPQASSSASRHISRIRSPTVRTNPGKHSN